MPESKGHWLSPAPVSCDLCSTPLTLTAGHTHFVDGKTRFGPWAAMCVNCHAANGVGLGTGRGQKYSLKTLEKVEG